MRLHLQDKLATVEAERAALAAEMEDHEGTLAAAQAEVHSLSSQLQRQLEQAHKEASTREAAALEAHKRQVRANVRSGTLLVHN